MSSPPPPPVNNGETPSSEGVERTTPPASSRFAQFQSSFYRKTSFAPKIKKKKGVVGKDSNEKQEEAEKGSSVTDIGEDIER